jgi:redox-sensitive bicupin YhaK (pirin superfamily)
MSKLSENYKLRKAEDRGHANHGWLDARFTFSFADYYDPQHMSFRTLRVMNNDRIEPGMGFGTHPHRDMEIISYIVEGELEHKDSMDNGSVIKAGNVQKITAGRGILHSEFNPSQEHQTFMYQIWIEPDQKGLEPSYQELSLNDVKEENGLTLFASNDKEDNVIHVNQDVRIYYGHLQEDSSIEYSTQKDRGIWIQMIDGKLNVNNGELSKGDGVAIEQLDKVQLKNINKSRFLLFDLK